MLVQYHERSKWLQEFSNFNIQEMKATMIMQVTKRAASVFTQDG